MHQKSILKRITSTILSVSMFAATIPASFADTVDYTEVGGVYYKDSAVVGCSNDAEDITILSNVNGTDIKSVNSYAFRNKDNLTSVVFEEGVTLINQYAFGECDNLSSVTLPDSLWGVNHSVFIGCPKLGAITLPEGMQRIGGRAFKNCTSLKEVTIPSTITDSYGENGISGQWFAGCTNLEKVTFSNGATSIPEAAFIDCKEVEIVIPDTVTTIGPRAFNGLSWITSLNILPENVKIISDYAFSNCTGLKNLDALPESVTHMYNNAFSGCTALETAILPDGFLHSNHNVFANCTSLKEVYLPEGMVRLGGRAFYNCTSLKEVTIPSTVTDSYGESGVSGQWFMGCTNLEKVIFTNGITAIPPHAFVGSPEIEIIIPDTVTSIGERAFNNVTWLDSLDFLPESIKIIHAYAFSGCTGLKNLDALPKTVTHMYNNAFSGCTALETAILPDGFLHSNHNVFANCTSLKEVYLPEGMVRLGGRAFYNCTSLKEVTIPSTVTDSYGESGISGQWFMGCTNLEKVTFSDGATIIPPRAFDSCREIEIVVPDTVTQIGTRAFNNVTWLKSLDFLPDNIKIIGEYAFNGCTSLLNIDELPDTVTNMHNGAFSNCTGLIYAITPKELTYIGQNCFSGCTSLINVSVSEKVKIIEKNAFSGCTALDTVYLPDSLTALGTNAFRYCPDSLVVHCGKSQYAAASVAASDIYHSFSGSWSYNTLNRKNTYFTSDTSTLLQDGYVTLIAKYDINTVKTGTPKNIRLTFTIPKDCLYIEGSAYVGRNKTDNVSLNNNILTVSGLDASGYVTIRLSKAGARDVISRAQLFYSAKLKDYVETLGTINDQVLTVSINTNPYANSDTTVVSGIATPSSDVDIYVNGKYTMTVKSNKAGRYTADVPLPDTQAGNDYAIRAIIDGNEETSAETTTEYNPDRPMLKSFVLYPNNHVNPGECVDLLQPGVIHRLDFWPVKFYIFKAEYTNPDAIENVYISSIKGNDKKQ